MLTLNPPKIKGSMHPRFEEILTPEALSFVGKLDAAIAGRRAELLVARDERQKRITAGEELGFLPSTASIREDPSWKVAPSRRVACQVVSSICSGMSVASAG